MSTRLQQPIPPRRGASFRQMALWGFVGLLCLNALLAVGLILSGNIEDQWRLCVTALLMTVACLVVAANAGAIEQRRLGALPYAAMACGLLGIASVIFAIWSNTWFESDPFWRLTGILLTLGTGGSFATMISLPRLVESWRPARFVALGAGGLLTLLAVAAFTFEDGFGIEPWAILAVITATGSILVGIGAAISRRALPTEAPPPPGPGSATATGVTTAPGATAGLIAHCPRCHGPLAPSPTGSSGGYVCRACGAGFRIELVSPPTA